MSGAGEGNRTPVTGMVVSGGVKWSFLLGIFAFVQYVYCTNCTGNYGVHLQKAKLPMLVYPVH
jgi:hypothetical protein